MISHKAILDVVDGIEDAAVTDTAADILDIINYAICPWCDADALPLIDRAYPRQAMRSAVDGHGDQILVCPDCWRADVDERGGAA